MTDILIVEDNRELATLLNDFLCAADYTVDIAYTGEEALELYERNGAKLVILDIMLPGMDGFAVCRRIRAATLTPIIIVSAVTEKENKLNGLILGADDYIEKPYDIDILLAKIDGIFKRRYQDKMLSFEDIRLDPSSRCVYKNDKPVTLPAKEYELLLFLMENKGQALSKDHIFNRIWGFDSESESQTVTVHITRLREKLETDPKNPQHILTVWGVGYRFE